MLLRAAKTEPTAGLARSLGSKALGARRCRFYVMAGKVYLGTFDTIEEVAAVYKAKS